MSDSKKRAGSGSAAPSEDLDRRKVHRMPAQQVEPLGAWVRDGAGIEHPCRVVDIAAGGAALIVPGLVAESLDRGQSADLSFFAPGGTERFRVKARVLAREEKDGKTVCRFSFEPLVRSDLRVPGLLRAFNQRRAKRLRPDPAELPLQVELLVTHDEGAAAASRAVPLDISARGIAVVGAAIELVEGDRVVVRLTLPGAAEAIDLDGTVRSRVSVGDEVRLGLEFDRRVVASSYVPSQRLLAAYLAGLEGAGCYKL